MLLFFYEISSKAFRRLFTNVPTVATERFCSCPIIFTMALPTMTPSQYVFIFFTCSGEEIPKPIQYGIEACCFIVSKKLSKSVWNVFLTPVTPVEDTQYKNPLLFAAMAAIRSLDVGATRLIGYTP